MNPLLNREKTRLSRHPAVVVTFIAAGISVGWFALVLCTAALCATRVDFGYAFDVVLRGASEERCTDGLDARARALATAFFVLPAIWGYRRLFESCMKKIEERLEKNRSSEA